MGWQVNNALGKGMQYVAVRCQSRCFVCCQLIQQSLQLSCNKMQAALTVAVAVAVAVSCLWLAVELPMKVADKCCSWDDYSLIKIFRHTNKYIL